MTVRVFRLSAVLLALLALPSRARADATSYIGRPIASVRITANGQELRDPELLSLVETRAGDPLTYDKMRETVAHLYSLGRYAEVQVDAEARGGSVGLTYVLVGLSAILGVDYTGRLALSAGAIDRTVKNAFAGPPSLDRMDDVVRALRNRYGDEGYLAPRIRPSFAPDGQGNRLTIQIDSGPRAVIGALAVTGRVLGPRQEFLSSLHAAAGMPYARKDLEDRIAGIERRYRDDGFYEAHITPHDTPSKDFSTVDLAIDVEPGPRVTVEQSGDRLTADELAALVPVRREASVDRDLLEDSMHQIEQHLSDQGFWKGTARYTPIQSSDGTALRIVIEIHKGVRYTVRGIEISGNHAFDAALFRPLMRTAEGAPYVARQFLADLEVLRDFYRRNGYASAALQPEEVEAPDPPGRLLLRVRIEEGPKTSVEAVEFEGNEHVPIGSLGVALQTRAGSPYYPPNLRIDRDRLLLAYLDRGYQNAAVEPSVSFDAETQTRATVTFHVHEGTQVLVDHVIVAGNTRTRRRIIDRELLLKPGQPLGLRQTLESQQRLSSLGLFRRVRITELKGGGPDPQRHDVVVIVEEAPATAVTFGAGIEAGRRLQSGETTNVATEHVDVAPRGSFEVARRNLGGKNRSIDVFTRATLRPTDPESGPLGLSEYRVLATFREPRLFSRAVDGLITGGDEQGIRSSFSFRRRGLSAQAARKFRQPVTVAARYTFQETHLFNVHILTRDQPLIDRLFPSVRLSSFSLSIIRDTRDDPIDPKHGSLLTVEGEVAGRHIGSEVGFAKGVVQAFRFQQTPWRGTVLALGARLGLAQGFARRDPVTGETVVDDLPASERFFAGGSTTVRGFALDQLGTPATIDSLGFPKGGDAMTVLNAELRVPVRGPFGIVGFLDAGNVFARVPDFRLGNLRAATGVGLRYRSPVGPVRVDLGFKLHRRHIAQSGPLESWGELSVSIGQAF